MEARVMTWLLLTVVAATLAATAEALAVPGCCSEGKWRATYKFINPKSSSSSTYLKEHTEDFTYDAPNQRTAELTHRDPNLKPTHVIKFYKTQVKYTYNPNTGTCTKEPLSDPFPKVCAPADSKVVGSTERTQIGKSWVNATRMYLENQTSDSETVKTYLVERDSCIVLKTATFTVTSSSVSFVSNIMTELNDDLWCEEKFKIPEACKTTRTLAKAGMAKTLKVHATQPSLQ